MRFDRRAVLTGAIVTALGIVNARAANRPAFNAAAFAAAQESGQIFVLEITAKWCGPCQRMLPELEAAAAELAVRDRVAGARSAPPVRLIERGSAASP